MTETQTSQTITALSTQGTYKNSHEIDVGGLPYTMREVLIAAPLIAGLNVYLVGATGEGKTQLANDLAGFLGEHYCYTEGRPDFELSEIMKQVNLHKLKDVNSDRELVELTENVRKALFYVDELNRCPPIVQNYFFNFFDGKFVHQGRVLQLGKDGYAVGYASGNIGNGAYVGTEDSDRALKDRMHMIVKLDDPRYSTEVEDDYAIFTGKKNPRASLPDQGKDLSERIFQLHREFGQREVPTILPVLGVLLHKGLDYLQTTTRNSKRAVDNVWPNMQGIRQDTDESKIMPLSKRAVLSSIGLTEALAMIAEAKGQQVPDHVDLFLDALQFTIPYSGVLAQQYVFNEKGGDAYEAFDAVMTGIKQEVTNRKEALETALAYASFGEREETALDKISPTGVSTRWSPVRRVLEHLADNQLEEKVRLDQIRAEYKKPAAR